MYYKSRVSLIIKYSNIVILINVLYKLVEFKAPLHTEGRNDEKLGKLTVEIAGALIK